MTTPPNEHPLAFTPVPLQRVRRTGWSPDRQRQFIAALARCGGVAAAARRVGLSPRSAYALLEKDGSDSFAAAWDQAALMGTDAMRAAVFDRALNGGWVPVSRQGRVIGMRFRHFDALAVSVLSGRKRDIEQEAADRRTRRETRRHWRDVDRRQAEQRRAEAEELAALARDTEEQLARYAALDRAQRGPRIAFL